MIKGMLLSTVIAITLLPGAVFAQGTTLGSKQFDNGGVYEGAFRNGLQHGQGTFRMPNGYEYTGDWVDGEIVGQGVARFANGSVYEGSFAKGKPEGLGKITYADGGTYEGSWLAGKITGQGVAIMQMAPDTKADSAKRCIMVAVCWSTPMDTSMTAIGSMASKKATPKSHIPMVRSIQAMSCAVRARGVADWKCQKD